MPGSRHSIPKAYAIALLLVAIAASLTFAITPWLRGSAPMVLYVIAVAVAASYGGIGPGLLATAVSVAVVKFFFADWIYQLSHMRPNLVGFAVVAVAISLVVEQLRRTNERLLQARSELEIANARLSDKTEALSRSNEELKRFAYALSHDLQTPLRSIKVFTELLMSANTEQMDEQSKRASEYIALGVDRMQSMITGLLHYSTVSAEDGRMTRVDCNEILRDVLLDLNFIITKGGAVVTSDPMPIVHANGGRLAGVFANLIENAIKYHSADRVPDIHISAKADGNCWILSVRDNGIGIDMQYADRIFGVFQRLHPWGRNDGNGIGLAICRATIEGHGGKIWVESEPGNGSTFLFTLPVRSDDGNGGPSGS